MPGCPTGGVGVSEGPQHIAGLKCRAYAIGDDAQNGSAERSGTTRQAAVDIESAGRIGTGVIQPPTCIPPTHIEVGDIWIARRSTGIEEFLADVICTEFCAAVIDPIIFLRSVGAALRGEINAVSGRETAA